MSDNTQSPEVVRTRKGHPGKIKNEVGNRYGRLVVLEEAGRNICQQVTWKCLCDCTKTTVVAGASLRNGAVVSCGCYHAEVFTSRTHGLSQTGVYRSFKEMVRRCTNPKHVGWADYGGRGIKVCDRWLVFENFYADMAPTWKEGLSIERKNVNGDYCPENCFWATMRQQNNNKRNNVRIQHDGKDMTTAEWARLAGISLPLFRLRRKLGWDMSRIVSTPARRCIRKGGSK